MGLQQGRPGSILASQTAFNELEVLVHSASPWSSPGSGILSAPRFLDVGQSPRIVAEGLRSDTFALRCVNWRDCRYRSDCNAKPRSRDLRRLEEKGIFDMATPASNSTSMTLARHLALVTALRAGSSSDATSPESAFNELAVQIVLIQNSPANY